MMTHSLMPIYSTTLIGRTQETTELIDLLEQATTRLITLSGTSGTGKTRLSLEVFTTLLEAQQPVVFIPLAAITAAHYVLPTIAHELGITEDTSFTLLEQLCDVLHSRPLILILDNFEQVLDAAPQIEHLLNQTRLLKILITSQAELQIAHEHVYIIPGLATPQTVPETLESALEYGAIQLFIQRIQDVQPAFKLDAANLQSVVQICQVLEGLPLAIELVAAHSDVLQPKDLKFLVQQHLMMYRMRSKHVSGRDRIILPLIEWSLLRLPDDVQALYNQLGCFHGGWTHAALQAVIDQPVELLQAQIDMLVRRHLILKQHTEQQTLRYSMLDAIQDYADTRFNDQDTEHRSRLWHRHLVFMARLAEQVNTDLLNGHNQQAWMTRMQQEMPNIRSLLAWGIKHDPDHTTQLLIHLGRFWQVGGFWQEGSFWYKQILHETKPTQQATALLAVPYSILLRSLNDYDQAVSLAEEGIVAAQAADEKLAEGRLYVTLGNICFEQRDYVAAEQYFHQALVIGKQLDSQFLISIALGNLANVNNYIGDMDSALVHYHAARDFAKAHGQTMTELAILSNIGFTYIMKREPLQALEYIDAALDTLRDLQAQRMYASTLHLKANALILAQLAGAAPLLKECLQIFADLGALNLVSQVLDTIAAYLEQYGLLTESARVLGSADRLREAVATPRLAGQEGPLVDDFMQRITSNKTFEQGRAVGRTWDIEPAINYALRSLI